MAYSDEQKVDALRRHLCNRMSVRASIAPLGCSSGSFAKWKADKDLVRKARHLGAIPGEGEDDRPAGGGDAKDPGAALLELLAEAEADPPDPLDISGPWLDRLCVAYSMTDDLDLLDDLLGWGRGVLAWWFEVEADPEAGDRPAELGRWVRRLRMARAHGRLALVAKLHRSNDPKAVRTVLEAEDPERWDPKFRELNRAGDGIDLSDEQLEAIVAARRERRPVLPPEEVERLRRQVEAEAEADGL